MRACVRAYVLACMRVGSFHHGELEDKEFQLLQGALLKSRKKLHFQLPTSAADRFRRGGPHETLSHIPVRRVHMHMEERYGAQRDRRRGGEGACFVIVYL